MKILALGVVPKWRGVVLAAVVSTAVIFLQATSAQAFDGGSWGGSQGSGGSWGGSSGGSRGGGLFGGRQPLRNLLGRIGSHHSRGSYGSGGSSGGFGYGSHGSSGSSLGSTGSSWGSSGHGWGSNGSISYVNSGSSGGYGSAGSSYGSSGSSYLGSIGSNYGTSYNSIAPIYSNPIETSYSNPIYDSGYSLDGSYMNGGAVMGSGTFDSGYSLEGGMPVEGGSINSNTFNPVPGINYEGSGDNNGSVQKESDSANPPSPPTPGPADSDDSTNITRPSDTSAVLNLVLPADAKVYINDRLTRTEGESRSYVSRNLKPASEYHYQVKAIVVRDGQELVRTQMVAIETGATETVKFDFTSTPVTTLALNVPADAHVKLCGKETSATGEERHYATSKLEYGKTWQDYTIEVSVERDGKLIRQERKLDLLAGETYALDFEFDATNKQVAAK